MRVAVAWIILVIWAAMYVRKLIDPSFPVPVEITPVMLLAAGYFFGTDIKQKLLQRVKKTLEEPDDV